MNNLVLLTGTVASPEDVAEAQRLTQAYVGEGTQVVSRLKIRNAACRSCCKVRIAEVNRSLLKKIGVNLLTIPSGGTRSTSVRVTRDRSPCSQARSIPSRVGSPGRSIPAAARSRTADRAFNNLVGATTLGLFGHIFGLGPARHARSRCRTTALSSTLAEPTLTALSGETASFLAGGEFPIPVSQGNNAVTDRVQAVWCRPRLHADRP